MKIKNKIFTLLSLFTLVGLTHSLTLKDLNAALTAPASYDLNYQYDAVYEETFVLGTSSLGTFTPIYTRTSDGAYYNYSLTIDNSDTSVLPLGLELTMTFNRSNTNWFSITGGYLPADTKIGSNSSVGVIRKSYLNFNNQTNKDYLLYFDFSSSANQGHYYEVSYNTTDISNAYIDGFLLATNSTNFTKLYIPSYTNFEIYSRDNSVSNYLDAWYLKDLGVSDSYDAGYEVGEDDGYADGLSNNPNVLLSGFQAMVGILVNFMLMILNLEVFGVSIMSVFGILALFVGVIWILKIVRG
jgi:hypothetical protein